MLSEVQVPPAAIFCAENALSGRVEITREMMSAVTALAFLWRKGVIAKLWRELSTLWSYWAVKSDTESSSKSGIEFGSRR